VVPGWRALAAPGPWTPACLRVPEMVPEAPTGRGQQRRVYLQEGETLEWCRRQLENQVPAEEGMAG